MRGKTSNGVKYWTPGRTSSGDPNTSVGNTMKSLLSVDADMRELVLTYCAVCELDYIVYGMGDDVLVQIKIDNLVPNIVPEELCAQLFSDFKVLQKQHYGWDTTGSFQADPVNWEFLSKTLLPAIEVVEGVEHYRWVFTPMAGRCIPKLFYSLNFSGPQDAWLRGVVLGVLPCVNHHPVFTELFRKILAYVGRGCAIRSTSRYTYTDKYLLQQTPEVYDWLDRRYGDGNRAENSIAELHFTSLPAVAPYHVLRPEYEIDVLGSAART